MPFLALSTIVEKIVFEKSSVENILWKDLEFKYQIKSWKDLLLKSSNYILVSVKGHRAVPYARSGNRNEREFCVIELALENLAQAHQNGKNCPQRCL